MTYLIHKNFNQRGFPMKIYIYRYGSICEPYISSFKRLGFEVDEETIEMNKKDLLPSECINITSNKIISGKYNLVFTINFFRGYLIFAILQILNT